MTKSNCMSPACVILHGSHNVTAMCLIFQMPRENLLHGESRAYKIFKMHFKMILVEISGSPYFEEEEVGHLVA
jgi:hypothetical protein